MQDFSPEAALAVIATFGIFILLALLGAVIVGHFIGKAAERKERSYAAFFILSILLSPLITALVVAALPFRSDDPNHPRNKSN